MPVPPLDDQAWSKGPLPGSPYIHLKNICEAEPHNGNADTTCYQQPRY